MALYNRQRRQNQLTSQIEGIMVLVSILEKNLQKNSHSIAILKQKLETNDQKL